MEDGGLGELFCSRGRGGVESGVFDGGWVRQRGEEEGIVGANWTGTRAARADRWTFNQ